MLDIALPFKGEGNATFFFLCESIMNRQRGVCLIKTQIPRKMADFETLLQISGISRHRKRDLRIHFFSRILQIVLTEIRLRIDIGATAFMKGVDDDGGIIVYECVHLLPHSPFFVGYGDDHIP